MFQATFLGHQGWLVSTETTNVLIDPLLTAGFGHGGLLGTIFPPRHLELAAFPPIDAVMITHEHDDHFDIPSLHALSRSIPVYLSARSSIAAEQVLGDMGFTVHALPSDQTLELGDLRYHGWAADHRSGHHGDEWDVFALLIHDAAGHGSLLSSVDVAIPERAWPHIRRLAPRPGIWTYANNVTSDRVQVIGPRSPAPRDDGAVMARVARRRYEQVEQQWGAPAATLVCGGGWSFEGERAWLDAHVFPLDSERIREALVESTPARRVSVAVPGHSVIMRDGDVLATRTRRSFLHALPRERWPSRRYAGEGSMPADYPPACGRRSISATELRALRRELDDFARYLYGRPVFQQLCSLPTAAGDGPLPTLGLALRTDRAPLVLRFDARGCRFVDHDGRDPQLELMSGLEGWAADLLALLRGEIGPTALCYAGRLRVWNADPRRLRISPHELWMFTHPLRRPAAALYRRLVAMLPDVAPGVRGRDVGGGASP